ncbi:MAG TPA: ribosome biogenesis GTP-binding protein YihA/YsxC [Syntrophorhabdaceae bacterium]|nr:ribosome biogenesis GTP-binding protein YihA/YsxC [Syntrophorhabdaceae bacterium]
MRIIDAKYVKSVSSPGEVQFNAAAEICFIGRSNVGKSSLINALVTQRVARTSSRPGATRMINIYKVLYESLGKRDWIIFSDFPGFGYAKVSRSMALDWQKMVEGYLPANERIKRIIWLLDVRRDFDDLDLMLAQWLHSKQLPFTPVLTKVDKETQGNIVKKVRSYEQFFNGQKAYLFSSRTGYGKKELLTHMRQILQNK